MSTVEIVLIVGLIGCSAGGFIAGLGWHDGLHGRRAAQPTPATPDAVADPIGAALTVLQMQDNPNNRLSLALVQQSDRAQ